MPWNNNGPGPWGSPGGNQGGGSSGGGGSGGGGHDGGDDGQPPPKGPWGGGGGGEPGGNRGGRRGPPGGGPFGPNGPFPDIDSLIQQAQAFIRNILPGGRGMGFGGVIILAAVVFLLWSASGF